MIIRKVKSVVRICLEQWRNALLVPRVYMGYFVGVLMILLLCRRYLAYAGENGIQIFEPFIVAMASMEYSPIIMLGLILIMLDAPFISARTPYFVTRSDRKSWYMGTMMYLFTQFVIYYFLIFIATVAIGFNHAYILNSWSITCYNLAVFQPTDALVNWGLYFLASEIVDVLRPLNVFIITFVLQSLYSALLLVLAYVINMRFRGSVGNIVAILLHLSGVALYKSFNEQLMMTFSLYTKSQILMYPVIEGSLVGLFDNILIFLILIVVILAVGRYNLKQLDYNIVKSGRDI